ncbi:MAG: hypothetical protein KGO96_10535 [Elusimicrobia bacterium]|nr:hypothetical protein [Elusimicrobiota bacterium]
MPIASGGAGPFGKDYNGILKQITADIQFSQTGALFPYDATFQTNIGGYPKGSMVASTSNPGYAWISTVDINTTDPDTGGAGWVLLPLFSTGTVLGIATRAISTRVSMTGNSGNSYTVTAWSPSSYTKVSATSTLLISLSAPTFTPASPGTGCATFTLNVGSAAISGIAANNVAATSVGQSGLPTYPITGLGAGAQAISLQYLFNTNWTTIFCPNSSDESYYPQTTAVLSIIEVGP